MSTGQIQAAKRPRFQFGAQFSILVRASPGVGVPEATEVTLRRWSRLSSRGNQSVRESVSGSGPGCGARVRDAGVDRRMGRQVRGPTLDLRIALAAMRIAVRRLIGAGL